MSHLILTAQRRKPTQTDKQLRQARDRMISAIRGELPFTEYARAQDRYMALREAELEAVQG